MQILDNGSFKTISFRGKPMMIRDFDKRLANLLEKSRNAILPRIHINIYKPTRFSRYNNVHFSRVYEKWCSAIWKKGKQSDAVEITASDYNFRKERSDAENANDSDAAQSELCRRNITLGDFLKCKQSKPCGRFEQKSLRCRKVDSYLEELQASKNSSAPPRLLEISNVNNSDHIFDIVDVSLENLESVDLQKEVAHLLPEYCTSQCFGERVSVRSNPTDKPFFVLFFEIAKEQQKLRIRINTNTPYSNAANRESLLQTLQVSKKFASIFSSLILFVFKTVEKESDQGSSRYHLFKEAFLPTNNSKMLASVAERSSELDKLRYVESYYNLDNFEVIGKIQDDPAVCCHCRSSYHIDLFSTMDGMVCRECMASSLIHQLRLTRFPLEITLLSPNDHPLYLLHAFLPVPVVLLLIEMSYNYLYKKEHPYASFLQCPQCFVSLTLPHKNEYNLCSCPECECYWCYQCSWEPHWPMTCNEFKEWSKKWDEQYFFEKFDLDEGERLLSIKCCCDNNFYVPEYSAHGAACPARNCTATYDKQGLMRCGFRVNRQFRWQPRRKQHLRCRKENGTQVTPKIMVPKKLIGKKFAIICAAARNERLSHSKRLQFEEAVAKLYSCKNRTHELRELRAMILLLVEYCTAWLYLHRYEKHTAAKSQIVQLFRSFMLFQEQISYLCSGLHIQEETIRRNMKKVLAIFYQCTNLGAFRS